MRKLILLSFLVVLLSLAISIYLYPSMPDKIISHWNAQGEVNGYMPKFIGLFLLPIISILLLLLFLALPYLDPLKKNILKFRAYYDGFILIFVLFFFYIYLLTILATLGFKFNMNPMIIPALAILFFYLGILVENTKRNWFIGIRTPWTLSSDKIWDKTHKFGGKLFKIGALVSLIGIFFKDLGFLFVLVPIFLISIYLIVYSYLEFRKSKTK